MLFVTCQISGALSYLESRQLIHRDISTRNCLVFSDYMIKLTDIAMASPIYSHYYSTDAHLPVRWMSPETLMVCLFVLFSNIFVFLNRMVEMVIQLNLMFIVLV
jgi:serine/threonine protein kinase